MLRVVGVIVHAVDDDTLSPDFPLGVELEVFIRREDAERFIEEVQGDEPAMAEVQDRGARTRGRRARTSVDAAEKCSL